jgi:hypothetical protein
MNISVHGAATMGAPCRCCHTQRERGWARTVKKCTVLCTDEKDRGPAGDGVERQGKYRLTSWTGTNATRCKRLGRKSTGELHIRWACASSCVFTYRPATLVTFADHLPGNLACLKGSSSRCSLTELNGLTLDNCALDDHGSAAVQAGADVHPG